MSDLQPASLLECAVEAATTAGRHALDNAGRRTEAVQRGPHDVKLRLDLECQEKAEAVVRARFPDHAILGEEDVLKGGRAGADSDYEWIIDPIDGTVNFSHGMPFFTCSIGVVKNNRTLAAAVYAPVFDELYTAAADTPSCLNGNPIRVSEVDDLGVAIVMTGVDRSPDPNVPPTEIFSRMADRIQRLRVLGCASLDVCRVACGQADGYYESGIYVWDVVPAGLIVEKAGGKAEPLGPWSGDSMQYIATNSHLHDALKQTVLGTAT